MISQVLNITKSELMTDSGVPVSIDALEKVENYEGQLILSMVSIERENVLRNLPPFKRNGAIIETKEPPVYINIHMMLTSYANDYDSSLQRLNLGMEFFQSKPFMKYTSILPGNQVSWPDKLELVLFEWHNLDLDKLNQLWGIHGGKYYPSVLYKVRMMVVEKIEIPRSGPPIIEVSYETIVK